MRRFSDVDLGDFHLRDKLLLEIDGKRHWIFHGDVFDASIHHMRWLARLGGRGYDALIRINRGVNAALQAMGQPRRSFSKRIKQGVKRAVKVVGDFERCAAELAIERGYDYVICGHIHVPQRRVIRDAQGRQVVYLNSGDWVESLTALEYHGGRWHIYRHDKSAVPSLPVARDRLPSGAGTPPAPTDPQWVAAGDVVQAVRLALTTATGQWNVLHIQHESPQARFSIANAKRVLVFAPEVG